MLKSSLQLKTNAYGWDASNPNTFGGPPIWDFWRTTSSRSDICHDTPYLKCQILFERPLTAYFSFLSRTIKVGFWHNWTSLSSSRERPLRNKFNSILLVVGSTSVFCLDGDVIDVNSIFLLQKVIRVNAIMVLPFVWEQHTRFIHCRKVHLRWCH